MLITLSFVCTFNKKKPKESFPVKCDVNRDWGKWSWNAEKKKLKQRRQDKLWSTWNCNLKLFDDDKSRYQINELAFIDRIVK